jgi:hypothetical protein
MTVFDYTDSQMQEYKQHQLMAEIAELERLIDGHRSSIAQIQVTIDKLSVNLPELE